MVTNSTLVLVCGKLSPGLTNCLLVVFALMIVYVQQSLVDQVTAAAATTLLVMTTMNSTRSHTVAFTVHW
jgi:hypothetical protein